MTKFKAVETYLEKVQNREILLPLVKDHFI